MNRNHLKADRQQERLFPTNGSRTDLIKILISSSENLGIERLRQRTFR